MAKNAVQTIEFTNFKWIDITLKSPKGKGVDCLKSFNFHPLDIEDCLSITHRSKCDEYEHYSFLILLFPIYDRKTREILTGELDFFINKNYLISVHRDNDLKLFNDLVNSYLNNNEERKEFADLPSERLLYKILNKLYLSCLPMLDHLSADVDHIEHQIFSGYEKEMVHEISIIRRNITDFRKIMQAHKNVLKKLIFSLKESPLFEIQTTDVYFNNLIDYTKEIWDALENYKERIEALQETNESLITFKLNDIMKILTIISVITLPINLIAALFTMNTPGIPFTQNPFGFWIVTVIMVSIAGFMVWHFKRKKWM